MESDTPNSGTEGASQAPQYAPAELDSKGQKKSGGLADECESAHHEKDSSPHVV